MRALRFEQTGDLAYLRCVECPMPEPREDEVLVRVEAAGVNRSDTSNVLGQFPYTTLPRTPGRDFAGVVVRGPEGLAGKAVWGSGKEIGFTRDGSHAEYIVLPADGVALKPASLSFAAAASCGVPFVTAWHSLENTNVARDTKLVVIGAAGGVGIAAIHLARMRGAHVVAAVRRPEQARALEQRGFATVLLAEDQSLAQTIRPHCPDGADVIIDTAGPWLPQSVGALARFGRVAVMVVSAQDGHINAPIRDLYRRGCQIVGINSLLYSAAECARLFEQISPGFERGVLCAPDGLEERPLESGREVYTARKQGHRGKFVFVPHR